MAKLYDSEKYLRLLFLKQGKTPEEIAVICKCSTQTIYRKLIQFGLMKSNKKY